MADCSLALRTLTVALLSFCWPSVGLTAPSPGVRARGWQLVEEQDALLRGQGRCNIDRRPGLTAEEFTAHYRDKEPVILGSPAHAPTLPLPSLLAHWEAWEGMPYMAYAPVGRPHVGAAMSTLGEHLAGYAVSSEVPPARASYVTGVHVSHMTLTRHPDLLQPILAARQGWGKHSAHPALCAALGYSESSGGSNSSCPCFPSTLSLGGSGAGAPWHWHDRVPGNELLWGEKRWFLSRGLPPGGFNSRTTVAAWVREVYPLLPPSAFARPHPALYECTLRAGEVLYFPAGMYHATVDIGHALAMAYDGCGDEGGGRAQARAAVEALLQQGEGGPHLPALPTMQLPTWAQEGQKEEVEIQAQGQSNEPVAAHHSNHSPPVPAPLPLVPAWGCDVPLQPSSTDLLHSGHAKAVLLDSHWASDSGLAGQLEGGSRVDTHGEEGEEVEGGQEGKKLSGLLHAIALWPGEPMFLLEASRVYLRRGRAWVHATYGPPLPYPHAILAHLEGRHRRRREGGVEPLQLDPASRMPVTPASHSASLALSLALTAARINPLSSEAWAQVGWAAKGVVGEQGWTVLPLAPSKKNKRQTGSRGSAGRPYLYPPSAWHLLDMALAAGRRGMELDPAPAAQCNEVAQLLALGAVDRYRFDGQAALQPRVAVHMALGIDLPAQPHALPTDLQVTLAWLGAEGGQEYHEAWMQVRGMHRKTGEAPAPSAQAGRAQRVHQQLSSCIQGAAQGMGQAGSRDALIALYPQLQRATDALTAVSRLRLSGPGKGHGWYPACPHTILQARQVVQGMRDLGGAGEEEEVQAEEATLQTGDGCGLLPPGTSSLPSGLLPLYLPPVRRSSLLDAHAEFLGEVWGREVRGQGKGEAVDGPLGSSMPAIEGMSGPWGGEGEDEGEGWPGQAWEGSSTPGPYYQAGAGTGGMPFLTAYAAASHEYRAERGLSSHVT